MNKYHLVKRVEQYDNMIFINYHCGLYETIKINNNRSEVLTTTWTSKGVCKNCLRVANK